MSGMQAGAEQRVRSQLKKRFLLPARSAIVSQFLLTFAFGFGSHALALTTPGPITWALAFVVTIAVQTRLSLFMHEGSHWLLASDKARNDRITNWLAAYPVLMTVEAYRANHLPHHTKLGTPEDRDFRTLCVPPMQAGVVASIVGTLIGLRHLQLLRKYLGQEMDHPADRQAPAVTGIGGRITVHAGIIAVYAGSGHPEAYIVLWLLPLLTFAVMINEIRTIMEHIPLLPDLESGGELTLAPVTRTVRPGWLGRIFLGPLSFCYHHEHHLFPSVPFARLRELHETLVEEGYYADKSELVWDGYGSLFRRVWSIYGPARVPLRVGEMGDVYVAERS